MNNKELQNLTEEISEEFFSRQFEHHAIFNNRLRSTGGRYILSTHNIEINPKQFEAYGQQAIINIIKHELCHYHLHLEGKGYKHQHLDFKHLSESVGAPRYCHPLPDPKRIRYKCKVCAQIYHRKRRIDIAKYRCGKCQGKLEIISS
ncbi:SprT family protein [Macrococcus hajekii]|uniref:Protein SprT-like n=1 Tax=Macrococcus hajekii TaxID=198482 RepID=A0A4R6BHQ1_9STAP|nr:SprT family protein [Macrococcus hajekii]TDM01065.1 SprT family protein [Macrococcus hajekii]GGB12679.1 protein SprT [Macrococcus hajekii]